MPLHSRRFARTAALAAVALLMALPAAANAADGVGTMTVAPTYVIDGSSMLYPVFTYTAASAINGGGITLDVPAGGTAPSAHGFDTCGTQGSCGDNPPTIDNSRTNHLTNVTPAAGNTGTIRYGLAGFNGGVTAPSSPGTSTFTAKERSSSGGTLTSLASSPAIVVGEDGTGTMTVSPVAARVSSSGNTLTFHYTATRTIASGGLTIGVPVDWSTPSATGTAAGFTTTTCSGGSVSVSGTTIRVSGMSLANGSSCDVIYGSKAAGGPRAHAPSTGGTETFSIQQESSNDANFQGITSPQVSVVGVDGGGTVSVSPTQVVNGSSPVYPVFIYTAPAGGITDGDITIDVPAGWTAPSAS